MQVELPKHGGRWDGGHSPGSLHSRVKREGGLKKKTKKTEDDDDGDTNRPISGQKNGRKWCEWEENSGRVGGEGSKGENCHKQKM